VETENEKVSYVPELAGFRAPTTVETNNYGTFPPVVGSMSVMWRVAKLGLTATLIATAAIGAFMPWGRLHLPAFDANRVAYRIPPPHAPSILRPATFPQCKLIPIARQDFMQGNSFSLRPDASYRHSPAIALEITEEGSMANLRLIRSSGIKRFDDRVVRAVSSWKYKPRPGCGVIESTVVVTIDFR
jgi:TonB family protein